MLKHHDIIVLDTGKPFSEKHDMFYNYMNHRLKPVRPSVWQRVKNWIAA
jgi:hypothetical protein